MMKYLETYFGEVINPIALRKAKIAYNFGLSECNRVKGHPDYGKSPCCVLANGRVLI